MKNKHNNLKILDKLLSIFFKIGIVTFGGGFAMIPLIEKEVVENHKWIKKEEFIDSISLTQTVPGPVAINLSVLIGYNLAGVTGALVAAFGVALPSFITILILATFFDQFSNNPLVESAFRGIRPAVVALILYAAFKLGKTLDWSKLLGVIFVASVIGKILLGISPVFIIVGAAIFGLIYHLINNNVLVAKSQKEQ